MTKQPCPIVHYLCLLRISVQTVTWEVFDLALHAPALSVLIQVVNGCDTDSKRNNRVRKQGDGIHVVGSSKSGGILMVQQRPQAQATRGISESRAVLSRALHIHIYAPDGITHAILLFIERDISKTARIRYE